MAYLQSNDIMAELACFITAQEVSASRVLAGCKNNISRLFAKTQAEAIFQSMRELRALIKTWDSLENDPTFQDLYPENQPRFDQAYIQEVK